MPIEVTPTLVRNFWRHVAKTDTCWLWTGGVTTGGYGRIGSRAGVWSAHRVSYTIHHGPIPDGLLVCHHCDVRPCVRPDHLFLGTQSDNLADMRRKGRQGQRGVRGEAHSRALLNEQQAREIIRRTANGEAHARLGEEYGVSDSAVSAIAVGQTWAHLDRPPRRKRVGRRHEGEWNPNADLTLVQVRAMRKLHAEGVSAYALAQVAGITHTQVWRIVTYRKWANVK